MKISPLVLSCVAFALVGCKPDNAAPAPPVTDSVPTLPDTAAAPPDTVAIPATPPDAAEPGDTLDPKLFQALRSRLAPWAESLRLEAVRIGRLPPPARDRAILDLDAKWEGIAYNSDASLPLDESRNERLWEDGPNRDWTTGRLERIFGRAGFAAYPEEGAWYTTSALGLRLDLLAPLASPAMRQFLSLRATMAAYDCWEDAGIVCPIDTLVERVLALEPLLSDSVVGKPATEQTAFLLEGILAGADNTPSHDAQQDLALPEFVDAWRKLAKESRDPGTRKLMKDWMKTFHACGGMWTTAMSEKNEAVTKVLRERRGL